MSLNEDDLNSDKQVQTPKTSCMYVIPNCLCAVLGSAPLCRNSKSLISINQSINLYLQERTRSIHFLQVLCNPMLGGRSVAVSADHTWNTGRPLMRPDDLACVWLRFGDIVARHTHAVALGPWG